MITRYNHVQITVPRGSGELVRRFYGQVLGMREIEVPDSMRSFGLIWFRVGERDELHVGQEDGIDRRKTGAHLAYEVSDMAAWRRRLAEQGIEMIEQPAIAGYDRVYIRDPFDNRVEFIGRIAG
jgi:catechol 2,3-dioxygenase-like lactoylglutathione lyase family enzyme